MTRLAPTALLLALALAACQDGDLTAPVPEENPLTSEEGIERLGVVPAPSLGPITTFDGGGVAIFDEVEMTSTIEITESASIVDLDVRLSLTHTFVADLTIWLESPVGTIVTLTAGNGGSGDHYTDTDFDDEAGASIASGAAPFTGSFQPEEPLSAFDGQDQAGTWTLHVYDDAAGDDGALLSWALDIETEGSDPEDEPPGPPAAGGNLMVGGHDTGVLNHALGDGTTLQDGVDACVNGAKNHGHFLRCVEGLATSWMEAGAISGREKGMITSAAATAGGS